MTPKTLLILGAVLSAAINAGIAYLAPVYQGAALALAGVVLGAIGLKRPGDVSPAQVEAAGNPAFMLHPVARVDPDTKSVVLQ